MKDTVLAHATPLPIYNRTMSWRRRVLVIEDEVLMASLLCETLQAAGFDAYPSHDALTARTAVEEVDPDAALIDIHLGPGPNGVQFGHWLHGAHPQVAQIYLTRHIDATAFGGEPWDVPDGSIFLAKDRISSSETLVAALDEGLRQSPTPTRHDRESRSPITDLTPTQREILRMVALGMTNGAIAAQRGTTERTVEQRLQTVYETLGISMTPDMNPRVQAARIYLESGGVLTTHEPLQ